MREKAKALRKKKKKTVVSKRFTSQNVVGIVSPLDVEVLLTFPARDWDDEELDEIANGHNPLVQILFILFKPCFFKGLRRKIYMMTFGVKKRWIVNLSKVDPDELETMVDGYYKDCGTKDSKFLSMSKCNVVTTAAAPHQAGEDLRGNKWVAPLELWRSVGQHNFTANGTIDHKMAQKFGCWKPPVRCIPPAVCAI